MKIDSKEIRRTTVAALIQKTDMIGADLNLDLDFLHMIEVGMLELKKRLELHKAGAKSCRAADVYNSALFLAALACLLAERGTTGYPYATNQYSGQAPLDF